MSWIGGEYVVDDISKETIDEVLADIRHRVRSESNLEEFPHMGDDIMNIRTFATIPFESYEEAYDYCMNQNTTWMRNYNVAVPFKERKDKVTKNLLNLNERLVREKSKLKYYEVEHSVVRFKAEFVGCPKCKSKLAKAYLKDSKCPICHEDMRSTTTKNTIKRYQDKIRAIEKSIQDEKKKQKVDSIKYLICFVEYIG